MKMKRAVSMGLKPSVFDVAQANPYTGQNKSQGSGTDTKSDGTQPVATAGTAVRGAGKPGNPIAKPQDPSKRAGPSVKPKTTRDDAEDVDNPTAAEERAEDGTIPGKKKR